MAKYVISSIPASLPKNQDGGLFRKKKKKKLNSMMDYTPPTDESTLVRGIEPQNTFGNYFNSPGIPTSDYKPYNIGEQYNTRVRSELEKVPLTDRATKELRRCDPNNPNSVWYNGKCMTEEEYLPLYIEEDQKEREDDESKFNALSDASDSKFKAFRNDSRQKLVDAINAVREKTNDMHDQWESEHYDAYTNTFKNSKKSDKIEPYDRIPAYTLDELTQDGITKRELYKNHFYMSENKETGMIDLYVKDMMKSRIINNGFRTKQFVDSWGLDKDQVDKEFGSFMKNADQLYNENRTAEILKLAKKKNITIEAAAKLIPKSVGSQNYISENITDPLNKQIDETFNKYIKTIKDGIGPFKKTIKKQKVNYDFNDDIYDTKEKDGVVISNDFNSIRQYTKAWVNAGKDEKEKKSRQAKVDAILKREYPEVFKELNENPITQGNKEKISTTKQLELSDHVYVNPDIMKNVTNNRRSDAYNQLTYQKRDSDLAELTGYGDDYNIYTQNLMQKQLYDLSVNALNTNNFSSLDKLKFIEGDNDYKEGRIYNDEYKKKIADIFSYDKYVERVTSPDQIRPGKSTTPLSLSEKIHDVAYDPFAAFDYWMNPRTQMWPDNATSDQGYQDRKKLEKKWQNYGLDLGTIKPRYNRRGMPDPSITGVFNFFAQPFNPAKIATDVYGGYEKNGWSGAGEELSNASYEIADRVLLASTFGASALSKMKYLRNLSNLNKASQTASRFGKFGIGAQKVTNLLNRAPLTAHISAGLKDYMKVALPVMTFDAVRPGGNFNQAYNDFSKGDNWYGVGNLALGSLGVLPYVSSLRRPISYINNKLPRIELQSPKNTFGIGRKDSFQLANTTDDFIRNYQMAGIKGLSNSNMTAAQKLLLEQEMAAGTVVPTFTSTAPNKLLPKFDGSMSGADFMKQNYGFNPNTLEMGQVVQPKKIFNLGNSQLQFGQKTYPLNFNEFVPFKPSTGSFNNYGLPSNQKGGTPSNSNTKNIVDSLRQLGSLNNFKKGGSVPDPKPPRWLLNLIKQSRTSFGEAKQITATNIVKNYFNSTIDWSKWNPDIISDKKKMIEYLNIEQITKENGTWLKNSDGTTLRLPNGKKASPEQFVQLQSKRGKKYFGKDYEKIIQSFRGVARSENFNFELSDLDKAHFAADLELGKNFTHDTLNEPNIITPFSVYRPYTQFLFNLATQKSNNSVEFDNFGGNWQKLDLSNPSKSREELKFNFDNAVQKLKEFNEDDLTDNTDDFNRRLRKNLEAKLFMNARSMAEFGKHVKNKKGLAKIYEDMQQPDYKFFTKENPWYNVDSPAWTTQPSTDDLANYIENNNLNYAIVKNVDDGGLGDVTIMHHIPGNYSKSLVGNNGDFDLNNRNVFKSVLPWVGLTGLGMGLGNNLDLKDYKKGGDVPTPPKWLTALLKKGASMGSSFKNLFTVPASVKKAFGYFPPVIPTFPNKTQLIDEVLNGQQLSGLTEYGSLLDNIDPGGQTLEDSFYRDLDAKSKKGFKNDILETLSKARDNSSFKYPNLVDVKDTDFTTESPFWMTYANLANLAKTGEDFSYIKPKMITDADYFTFQDLKKQFHGQKKWHTDMMDFKSTYHTKKQKDELREKVKEYGLPYETDQDLFEALYKSRPQDFSSKMYKINHLDFLKKTGRYDYLKAISKGEFDSDFPLSFDLKHKYFFSDNVDKLPFWHDQSLKVGDNYISYLNDATTHRDLVDLTTAFDPWWAEGLPKNYYHSGLAGMTDFNTEKSLLLKFIQLKYGKKRAEERLDYQNPKHKYHPLRTDPRGWDPKYLNKTGGVIKNSLTSKKNGITMNLSKSEINKYIAEGYIIEDV